MESDPTLELLLKLQQFVENFPIGWLVWFTVFCIVIGGAIGWFKNRIGFGLLMAALFGPIGWIIVALSAGDFRPCPKCGKPNPSQARRCRHCATLIPVVTSAK